MIGPEKLLVAILGTLLAISLGLLLFVEIDLETTRRIAIAVCVALTMLLAAGVIFPVRRYLRQKREHRSQHIADQGDQ